MKKKKIAKRVEKNPQVDWSQQSLVLAFWFIPLDATQMFESAVVNVRYCSHLAINSLFKVTSGPQFVADSSGLGCS